MKHLTESEIEALVKRQAEISLLARAHALLREAEVGGFVLTIEQVSEHPPRMGALRGVVTVRPSRAAYTAAKP
jgi:hypothetical protein